ncbi:MAG: hypothetical protein VX379_10345 [Pseudomonadota bacterium]|nr:hypothetical protein [Pseudomonadota bacterium]MEE3320833.1 hypothetical protein [Pseudomonadota bacterium]
MSNLTFWLRHPESSRAIAMRRQAHRKEREPVGETIPMDGVYCGDFPAIFSTREFDGNKKDKENQAFRKAYRRWGGVPWAGIGSPVMLAIYARFTLAMGFFFFVLILFGTCIEWLFWGVNNFGEQIIQWSLWAAAFLLPWRLLAWLIDKNVFPEGNLAIFQRDTGLVRVPLDKKDYIELPFEEFIPGISLGSSRGYPRYGLVLIHRYTGHGLSNPGSISDSRKRVFLEWEFIRQYMDPTLPIPDTPDMESIRQDDPVTRQWDAQYGRPTDFWRSMSDGDYYDLIGGSADNGFPWDELQLGVYPEGWQQGSAYSRLPWVAAVRDHFRDQAPDIPPGTWLEEGADQPIIWEQPPKTQAAIENERRTLIQTVADQPAPALDPEHTYQCDFCQGGVMGRYAITAGGLIFCGDIHREEFLKKAGIAASGTPSPDLEQA